MAGVIHGAVAGNERAIVSVAGAIGQQRGKPAGFAAMAMACGRKSRTAHAGKLRRIATISVTLLRAGSGGHLGASRPKRLLNRQLRDRFEIAESPRRGMARDDFGHKSVFEIGHSASAS